LGVVHASDAAACAEAAAMVAGAITLVDSPPAGARVVEAIVGVAGFCRPPACRRCRSASKLAAYDGGSASKLAAYDGGARALTLSQPFGKRAAMVGPGLEPALFVGAQRKPAIGDRDRDQVGTIRIEENVTHNVFDRISGTEAMFVEIRLP